MISIFPPDETGEAIDARSALVVRAQLEIGEQDPDKYWRVVQPKLMGNKHRISWCGGFALWCLREVKLCDWEWIIYGSDGNKSGFLFRLKRTDSPLPGDIAYFEKNQHHAIVEKTDDELVHSIDGNTMPYPREGVRAYIRHRNEISAFYSIASLISEQVPRLPLKVPSEP